MKGVGLVAGLLALLALACGDGSRHRVRLAASSPALVRDRVASYL